MTARAPILGYPRRHAERTPPGRHLDAASDATRTPTVPLLDAARTLGVSRDALRKRLDRGTLRGEKRRGEWWVYLDELDAASGRWTPPVDASPDGQPDRIRTVPDGSDAERTPADATPDRPTEAQEGPLVDQLRGENVFLRGQVEALQERLRKAHVPLAQQAVPAPANLGSDSPEPNPGTESHSSRPWWAQWWLWGRVSGGTDPAVPPRELRDYP